MKLENDIAQHLEQGEFLALATIIDRSGSAPRHAGAQMLFEILSLICARHADRGAASPV